MRTSTRNRPGGWAKTGQTIALAVASLLVGGGATLVLLLGYVIGKLYLAGHSIEPRWYDSVASFVVFAGGLTAAIVMFVLGRRALGEKKSSER